MRAFLTRLTEVYEGSRYRRTYGRNADHSRALAAAAARRETREPAQQAQAQAPAPRSRAARVA